MSKRRRIQPYAWLGTGAVVLGLGAAMVGGTAVAAADTLLLTVPNQLGVDYNAHVLESLLTHVAPALGWR